MSKKAKDDTEWLDNDATAAPGKDGNTNHMRGMIATQLALISHSLRERLCVVTTSYLDTHSPAKFPPLF